MDSSHPESRFYIALGLSVIGAILSLTFAITRTGRLSAASIQIRDLNSSIKEQQDHIASIEKALHALETQAEQYQHLLDVLPLNWDELQSDEIKLAALEEYTKTPTSGWILYGIPCSAGSESADSHPAVHNRQIDLPNLAPNGTPNVGDTANVRGFVTVWPAPPNTEGDSDDQRQGVGWYLPESTLSGVLAPGTKIKITAVRSIKHSPTFVKYELVSAS